MKLSLTIFFILTLVGCQSTTLRQNDPNMKIINYSGGAEIPKSARPNDATISYYEIKRQLFIDNRIRQGRMYTIHPIGNALPFKLKTETTSLSLNKELSEGYMLSYLYYENGVIKYDGKARDGRFKNNINNQTYFFTRGTGKSIVSYIVGHAICDGYITSIDEIIDWPMMRKTLYQGQPLRDLLNMSAGDRHTVDKKAFRVMGSGFHHRHLGLNTIAELLEGTKSKFTFNKTKEVFYNNVLADVIHNYVVFKANKKYDELMRKVFQDKIKIKNIVFIEKHAITSSNDNYIGDPQTRATTYFLMTRMDLLRTAEAIMKDYKNNTCVGQYLKEVQSKARYWHRPSKSGLSVTTREYGAMFYFGYDGMYGRNIFGTVGGNGQNMMIDMDNSRIIVTNSAATGWSQKKFIHEVIKSGKLPN